MFLDKCRAHELCMNHANYMTNKDSSTVLLTISKFVSKYQLIVN
jgi:hypothetical protein